MGLIKVISCFSKLFTWELSAVGLGRVTINVMIKPILIGIFIGAGKLLSSL